MSINQLIKAVVVGAVALVIGVMVYNFYFGPTPEERALTSLKRVAKNVEVGLPDVLGVSRDQVGKAKYSIVRAVFPLNTLAGFVFLTVTGTEEPEQDWLVMYQCDDKNPRWVFNGARFGPKGSVLQEGGLSGKEVSSEKALQLFKSSAE